GAQTPDRFGGGRRSVHGARAPAQAVEAPVAAGGLPLEQDVAGAVVAVDVVDAGHDGGVRPRGATTTTTSTGQQVRRPAATTAVVAAATTAAATVGGEPGTAHRRAGTTRPAGAGGAVVPVGGGEVGCSQSTRARPRQRATLTRPTRRRARWWERLGE